MVAYIDGIYRTASTKLKGNGVLSESIRVTQGVKQGDPLSSVLYNLVIDYALAALDGQIGTSVAGAPLNHLAFADDMILLARTREGLQAQVNRFVSELAKAGLTLNAAKCATMATVVNGKTRQWACDPTPYLKISNEHVPAKSVTDTYRYLGIEMTVKGSNSKLVQRLNAGLERISKAPLKPQQRVWFLQQNLLPAMIHEATLAKTTLGELKNLDMRIRSAVRSWLKLPKDTTVPFFYASVEDGGLGLTCLRFWIPPIRANRLRNAAVSEDPVVKAIVRTSGFRRELSKWSKQSIFKDLNM